MSVTSPGVPAGGGTAPTHRDGRRAGRGPGGRRRPREERGTAAVWTMILTTTAFVGLLGLVGGGGELVNDRVEAHRVAEQAARAGADELSAAAARSGTDRVNPGAAIARAHTTLRQGGWSGSVRIRGRQVIVTATGSRQPQFLGLLGVGSARCWAARLSAGSTRTASAAMEGSRLPPTTLRPVDRGVVSNRSLVRADRLTAGA